MNKVKFLVATLLGVLFVACSEEENLSQTGKTGFLVSLAEDVKVDSRKTPEELGKPAASQFNLKITNQTTGSELYSGSYTEDLIPVSAGMYEIEATYGDNPVLALNAPYYKGTAEAELADGESKTVQVNCKVANALASVVFDNSGTNTFESQFVSYGVRVSVNTSVTTLPNDGKSAYYRAGSMPVFTFVGTLRNGGGEKEVPLENSDLSNPSTFAAGKHCRITLKLSDAAPGLRVEISKVEVNSVTINKTIPLEWLPKPKVTAEGFDGNNTLNFVETEAVTPKLDFALSSALQDMKLKFDFEDEQFASLDKEKEYLLSNAADKAAIEEALGILLPDVGDTQANIDLSALTDKLHTNNGTATTNTITVDVQANNRWSSEDESTNLTYTLVCNKPEFSVAVQPGNCWSWEFTVDEVTVTSGDAEKIKSNLVYQYYDGTNWVNCNNGLTQKFEIDESRKNVYLTDKPAERTYQVRALYRGAVASDGEVIATLEEPWQLPNGDMEAWTDLERYNQPYYLPWGNNIEQWWDTNNNETMPGSYSTYPNYKCFPTTAYTNSGFSGKAAEIRSVAVNGWNSELMGSGETRGVLYIGITDNDGNMTEGKDWNSRPSKVTFMYKYDSQDNEHFGAYFELLAEDGTSIVSGNFLSVNGQDVSAYAKVEIPLEYSNTQLKAATIKIRFVTVADGESVYTGKQNITIPAGNYKIYGGSVLTIDDIELVYDK